MYRPFLTAQELGLQHAVDPLQFVCQEDKGVEDTVPYMLHRIPSFLYESGGFEQVASYKYTGMHLDNKLDSPANTHNLYKSRLSFLRRLKPFDVCTDVCTCFVVPSFMPLFDAEMPSLTKNSKKLDKLVKRPSSWRGVEGAAHPHKHLTPSA